MTNPVLLELPLPMPREVLRFEDPDFPTHGLVGFFRDAEQFIGFDVRKGREQIMYVVSGSFSSADKDHSKWLAATSASYLRINPVDVLHNHESEIYEEGRNFFDNRAA